MHLMLGDCMVLLKQIPDASVQMVLADLPYGTTNCKWDCPLSLDALWEEYRRVCTGAVVLFAQCPFDKVLGSSNLAELRYEWIWEKGNATGHLNAKRAPMKAHENVLVFCRSQPIYNPIKTTGHVRKAAVRRNDTNPIWGKRGPATYDSTERYPRSIVKFSSDKQRGGQHPTQKPLALCEYLIRTHSHPGDIVLDNVMGAGTTGVAALNTGRGFIGMELDKEWFEVSADRLRQKEAA